MEAHCILPIVLLLFTKSQNIFRHDCFSTSFLDDCMEALLISEEKRNRLKSYLDTAREGHFSILDWIFKLKWNNKSSCILQFKTVLIKAFRTISYFIFLWDFVLGQVTLTSLHFIPSHKAGFYMPTINKSTIIFEHVKGWLSCLVILKCVISKCLIGIMP